MPKVPRLREVRERAALSQAELARLAGVSRPTITRAEQGQIAPQWATIRKLARALAVAPADLRAPPAAPVPAE